MTNGQKKRNREIVERRLPLRQSSLYCCKSYYLAGAGADGVAAGAAGAAALSAFFAFFSALVLAFFTLFATIFPSCSVYLAVTLSPTLTSLSIFSSAMRVMSPFFPFTVTDLAAASTAVTSPVTDFGLTFLSAAGLVSALGAVAAGWSAAKATADIESTNNSATRITENFFII